MYVCLCHAVTRQTVADAVARGACSSKAVAAACGAGSDCGRCRCTVRAIISAELREPGPTREWLASPGTLQPLTGGGAA
ncbi:MAG TPA: (2Fe-2S)-binding protein [Aldersonia sp.]